MTPEQKARQIAGISPKANINNQRFENRCMYVAAMYMYKWTKKRAAKWLKENTDGYAWSDEGSGKHWMEDDFIEDFKKGLDHK